MPGASALVLQVPSALEEDGSLHQEDFSQQNGIDFSFSFAPNVYNTTGFNNSSVREGNIYVEYFVDEVEATGFLNFWGKVAGSISQSREYRSTFIISETDYYNITTLFNRKQGFLQGFAFEICNTVTYFHNGTTYGAGTACENSVAGGSPNHLTHVLKYGYVFGNGTERGFMSRVFTDETRQGGSLITSKDLLVDQTNFTVFTSGAIGSLRNLAEDASITKIRYLFTTFANHDATIRATTDADARCKEQRGFVSAVGQTLLNWATLGASPECFTAEDAINGVFGFVNKVLSVVFGFFPGGDKLAAFITQLLAIVVGIPVYATTLFLSTPAKSLIYWTWFFTMIGIVRYGMGGLSTDPGVIISTPWMIWRTIFKGILGFAKWLYEMVVAIATAIAGIFS